MGWCYCFPLWAVPNVAISGSYCFPLWKGPGARGEGGLGMDKSFLIFKLFQIVSISEEGVLKFVKHVHYELPQSECFN